MAIFFVDKMESFVSVQAEAVVMVQVAFIIITEDRTTLSSVLEKQEQVIIFVMAEDV